MLFGPLEAVAVFFAINATLTRRTAIASQVIDWKLFYVNVKLINKLLV